jgi:hypothetical protein
VYKVLTEKLEGKRPLEDLDDDVRETTVGSFAVISRRCNYVDYAMSISMIDE